MTTALTVVALLLLGVVVLLALPVELVFAVQNEDNSRNRVELILFSIVRVPLPQSSQPSRKPAGQKQRKRNRRNPVAFLRNAAFRQQLWKSVQHLVHSIKIRALDVHVRLGLADPADTGQLWGLIGALSAMLPRSSQTHLRIEPDFAAEVFAVRSQGRIRIVPMRILLITVLFLFSPSVLRMMMVKS